MEPAAPTPEPTQRLPSEARGYFVIGSLLWTVPLLVAGLAGTAALDGAGLPGWAAWSLRALVVAVAVAGSAVVPMVRWRTWRYEVRPEELDLLRGVLVVTRTLIPMARVQHVDTERNPLADLFDLRIVTVHTAAGSHDIPALRPGEAVAIRDRIAQLARMPDDV